MIRTTNLITNKKIKTPIIEAYKTLRTNIQFSSLDKEIKSILITSPGPSDGKSTVSANLAITMAQSDIKVLLIDCDLRKGALHRAFGLLNAKGLTNILVEKIDYKEIANVVGVPNLEVITTGPKPPNPSELLGSASMKKFIEQIKQEYDMILLDAPPVVPVTDAAVLSRIVDGVILVASYGQTTFDVLARAKENLQKVNANILGAVLNRVPTDAHGGYYYYYYYYDESGQKVKKKRQKSPGSRSRREDDAEEV